MRIAVIGASGRTGREIVRQALERGDEVIAVVRTAAKAPAGTTAAVAESRDVPALTAAIAGADAVISALGQVKADGDAHLLETSAEALLSAMAATHIRRLVIVSASGAFVDKGDDPLTRFIAKPILNRVLRANMDDTRAMEHVVRASGLDWTTVRPSRLVPKGATPNYRTAVDRNIPGGFNSSYASVAKVALDALDTPDWIGHSVAVAI